MRQNNYAANMQNIRHEIYTSIRGIRSVIKICGNIVDAVAVDSLALSLTRWSIYYSIIV